MRQIPLFVRVTLVLGLLIVVLVAGLGGSSTPARAGTGAETQPQSLAIEAGVQRLTIPAAAFSPGTGYYSYENHGRYLKHLGGIPGDPGGYYDAPVILPQGATITRLTLYYRDPGVGQAEAVLIRHQHYSNDATALASVASSDTWTPSFGQVSTTSFGGPLIVDNTLYAYFVALALPAGGTVWACAVEIEYLAPAQAPVTGVVTMPPAAFFPFEDGYSYLNGGWNLAHTSNPARPDGRGWYLAPVHLPDGATVTRMTFYWRRQDTLLQGTAKLQRTILGADTYEDMAVASSEPGAGGFISSTSDTTIQQPVINNALYAYWLILDLPATNVPGADVNARDIEIRFQYPASGQARLSVPAAAFRPYEDGYDFENHARHLLHKHGPGGSLNRGWYLAPVELPDGARIDKMIFYWFRNSTETGQVLLQRTSLGEGNYENLGVAASIPGSAANGSTYDGTIAGGLVDNSRYAYWLLWDLPAGATGTLGVHGQAVTLEYTPTYRVYLPAIQKGW